MLSLNYLITLCIIISVSIVCLSCKVLSFVRERSVLTQEEVNSMGGIELAK